MSRPEEYTSPEAEEFKLTPPEPQQEEPSEYITYSWIEYLPSKIAELEKSDPRTQDHYFASQLRALIEDPVVKARIEELIKYGKQSNKDSMELANQKSERREKAA